MRRLVLLLSLVPFCAVLIVGCGSRDENVVVTPSPNHDEAAETLRSEIELETHE